MLVTPKYSFKELFDFFFFEASIPVLVEKALLSCQ